MSQTRSKLCHSRATDYQPKLPVSLREGLAKVVVEAGEPTESIADQDKIKALFPSTYGAPVAKFKVGEAKDVRPLNVGVVLSGGQAPGGHNVISGIYDGVKSASQDSRVLGFLGGPGGLVDGKFIEIDDDIMDNYRNSGGFDIIGSGRTKLEDEDQFKACIEVAKTNNLDAIVIIGGDDSNTNAAVLAEYFKANNVVCSVVGCPKTIDGDLKNKYIETPFGFDTAAKTYAALIGNIARDANSAKKYWHFIKLMGRSATHIGLECALQTQPNVCLISEEVEAKQMTLAQVVSEITDVVEARAKNGKKFGIALIPEGLVEFIPEMKTLIRELNDALVGCEAEVEKAAKIEDKVEIVSKHLTAQSAAVLSDLPAGIQLQLLLDRDPHGNVQVSLIETEKLLIEMVAKELENREGYSGKFKALNHFFGYEGRCAHPSNFDADYAYALGFSAAVLAQNKMTGYISAVSNLKAGVENWVAGGIPTSMLMNIERRHGEDKPVIQKALVDLEGPAFKKFAENREKWAMEEAYLYPGAIQYFGPSEICDAITETLKLGA
ncbi:MAG: diphosphate--fructose-6-phosphate 1-phosphotransferase [Deltaproteobacteria bacterium]|nr:diphosphate--fructose-6-phosphate 1-phosphotransferase [Deltaproteobacteria bacterium]